MLGSGESEVESGKERNGNHPAVGDISGYSSEEEVMVLGDERWRENTAGMMPVQTDEATH